MATANTRKPSAAAGKKPRAAGGARAVQTRATAVASPLDAAALGTLEAAPLAAPAKKTSRKAAPRAKAVRPAKAARPATEAVKPAAKARKAAPAKDAGAVKKPAAKKAPARKSAATVEAGTAKKSAASTKVVMTRAAAAKAPRAKAAAPRAAKVRAAKPQAPAVLNVASMVIDTSLAAECAANTILQQAGRRAAPRGGFNAAAAPLASRSPAAKRPAPKREGTLLRELKEAVSNPASHQLDNLFAGNPPAQAEAQPFGARKPFSRREAADRSVEPNAGYLRVPRHEVG